MGNDSYGVFDVPIERRDFRQLRELHREPRPEVEKNEQQLSDKPKKKRKLKVTNNVNIRLPKMFNMKERLRANAKRKSMRYHTLAAMYVIEGIERDEKLFEKSNS